MVGLAAACKAGLEAVRWHREAWPSVVFPFEAYPFVVPFAGRGVASGLDQSVDHLLPEHQKMRECAGANRRPLSARANDKFSMMLTRTHLEDIRVYDFHHEHCLEKGICQLWVSAQKGPGLIGRRCDKRLHVAQNVQHLVRGQGGQCLRDGVGRTHAGCQRLALRKVRRELWRASQPPAHPPWSSCSAISSTKAAPAASTASWSSWSILQIIIHLTHLCGSSFEERVDVGIVDPHRSPAYLLVVEIPHSRSSRLGIYTTESSALPLPYGSCSSSPSNSQNP